MSSIIDPTTEKETDIVLERILGEWSWCRDADTAERKKMKHLQEELLSITSRMNESDRGTEEYAHYQEQRTVITKQLRRMRKELLQQYES